MVEPCQSLSSEYKTILSETIVSIQSAIISISKEITYVQSQFLQITGQEVILSSLDIFNIDEITGEVIQIYGSWGEQDANEVK